MKKFIKNFKKNWLAKLICLILAVLLYFYVLQKNEPEKYISLNLNLKNLPQKLAVANQYKNEILIKVKGKEYIIQTLSQSDFLAFADLKNASSGLNIIPVKIETKTSKKFRIVKVEPSHIEIKLDKLETKEVPVIPTIIGTPADGYKKLSEKVFPEKVLINGPKSLIENIIFLRLKPVDITGITESVYREVEFDTPSEFINVLNYKTAKISINILKDFKTKLYKNVEIKTYGLPSNLYIKNPENLIVNEIKLYGPLNKLNSLKDFLFVDLSDIQTPGDYEKEITANIPENCSILYINPKKIEINIRER